MTHSLYIGHSTQHKHLASVYLHQRKPDLHLKSASGLLPKFNNDFLAQEYIYSKLFTKIQLVFAKI